jgi:WD40 repeat protein
VAVGFANSHLVLYDVATGQRVKQLIGHTRAVNTTAFSPDGQTLLTSSNDQTARLWNLNDRAEIRRLETGGRGDVFQLVLSPNGRRLFSGGLDQLLVMWDATTGETLWRFEELSGGISSLAFSPDGRTALSASWNDPIILWDVETGAIIRRYDALRERNYALAYSPDGQTFLMAASIPYEPPADLVLRDVATGEEIRRFGKEELSPLGYIYSVAFSPDGQQAVSASFDGTAILWDATTGNVVRRLVHPNFVSDARFSPDGRTILTTSGDANLRLWDTDTGQEIHRYAGHNTMLFLGDLTRDGHFAVSVDAGGNLIVWNLESGEAVRRLNLGSEFPVIFSADGQSLFIGGIDTIIQRTLWLNLDDLLAWTEANRYVPELTCDQRELYRLEPLCNTKGKLPSSS